MAVKKLNLGLSSLKSSEWDDPSWRGIPLKYISLGILVVQNSSLVLVLRYSRTLPGEPYLTSTAVLMSEVIKLIVSGAVYWFGELEMQFVQEFEMKKLLKSPLINPSGEKESYPESVKIDSISPSSNLVSRSPQSPGKEGRQSREAARLIVKEASAVLSASSPQSRGSRFADKSKLLVLQVFAEPLDALKMAVPAVLYFVQNNLQYVAATYLDAATFQVTYQMKILTTALLSVLILKTPLNVKKWVSLVILTIGIILVQTPAGSKPELIDETVAAKGSAGLGANTTEEAVAAMSDSLPAVQSHHFAGLAAVSLACVLSGFAGVYFEKVLKNKTSTAPPTSLWVRNIQLGIFSIVPGIVFGVWLYDGSRVAEKGFFQGYNFWTWVCVFMQAAGGIIVALVVKYANNILKGFATSISIIGSSFVSVYLFNFVITLNFLLGCSMVIYATFLYGGTNLVSFVKMFTKS